MARFYAKFDSGSAGWNPDGLENNDPAGWFERLRISLNSASAATLRDGLIASRSALSNDVYEDLDSVNRNGALGTYFPPDSGPRSTDGSTFISWSSAYTSSVPGIVTPSNYRTRPTASILSTQTTLVQPTTPTDPVGVSYLTYISASTAVKAVLDAIQTGTGTLSGPYERLGNDPSRTLHSIWHDPNLQYFAWDDFTPGQPQTFTVEDPTGVSDSWYYSNPFYITMSWGPTYQFKNDETARPVVSAYFESASSEGILQTLSPTVMSAGAQSYFWQITATPSDGAYQAIAQVKFRDSGSLAEGRTSDGTSDIQTTSFNLVRLIPTQSGYRASYSSNCADYTAISTYYYSPVDLGSGFFNMYNNTDSTSVSGVVIGYYNFGSTAVYEVNSAGLLEPFTPCTGSPPASTTTTTTEAPPCKNEGEACTAGTECCSGICTELNVCGPVE